MRKLFALTLISYLLAVSLPFMSFATDIEYDSDGDGYTDAEDPEEEDLSGLSDCELYGSNCDETAPSSDSDQVADETRAIEAPKICPFGVGIDVEMSEEALEQT